MRVLSSFLANFILRTYFDFIFGLLRGERVQAKVNMTKGFQYSILASGSSGNCFYLETDQKRILVDAGLSGKKITSLLGEIGRKPEDLDAILVTHEHKDHIHGVGVLARKYHLDIYANEATWKAMEKDLGKLDAS